MIDDDLAVFGDVAGASAQGRTDRAGARTRLLALWQQIGEAGDALHRVAVAHALADVVDDVASQIEWDLRALGAAGELTDARVAAAGMAGGVGALLPSLHLNLADGYAKTAQAARAGEHVAAARAALRRLETSPYLAQIAASLDRIDELLRGG